MLGTPGVALDVAGLFAPLPLAPADKEGRGGVNDGVESPPPPMGEAFEMEPPPPIILPMKSDMDWGAFPPAAAAAAPPDATAAPSAAPVAAACATSPVPKEVEPDASVAAMLSDLNVR